MEQEQSKSAIVIGSLICSLSIFFLIDFIIIGPLTAGAITGIIAVNRKYGALIGLFGAVLSISFGILLFIFKFFILPSPGLIGDVPSLIIFCLDDMFSDPAFTGFPALHILFMLSILIFGVLGGFLSAIAKEKFMKKKKRKK